MNLLVRPDVQVGQHTKMIRRPKGGPIRSAFRAVQDGLARANRDRGVPAIQHKNKIDAPRHGCPGVPYLLPDGRSILFRIGGAKGIHEAGFTAERAEYSGRISGVEVTHEDRRTFAERLSDNRSDVFHLTLIAPSRMGGMNPHRAPRRRQVCAEQNARLQPVAAARQVVHRRRDDGKRLRIAEPSLKPISPTINASSSRKPDSRSVAGANTTCRPSASARRCGTLP